MKLRTVDWRGLFGASVGTEAIILVSQGKGSLVFETFVLSLVCFGLYKVSLYLASEKYGHRNSSVDNVDDILSFDFKKMVTFVCIGISVTFVCQIFERMGVSWIKIIFAAFIFPAGILALYLFWPKKHSWNMIRNLLFLVSVFTLFFISSSFFFKLNEKKMVEQAVVLEKSYFPTSKNADEKFLLIMKGKGEVFSLNSKSYYGVFSEGDTVLVYYKNGFDFRNKFISQEFIGLKLKQ